MGECQLAWGSDTANPHPHAPPMLFDTDLQFATFLYFKLQKKRRFLLLIYCFVLCVFLPHPSHVKLHFLENVIQNYYFYGVNTSTLLFVFQFHCRGKSFLGKPCPPDMLFETPHWGGGNAFWVTRPVYIYSSIASVRSLMNKKLVHRMCVCYWQCESLAPITTSLCEQARNMRARSQYARTALARIMYTTTRIMSACH